MSRDINMDNITKVSVIVAVHNGAATLGKALDSIAAQTLREIETVIVDDGSNDDTADVIKSWIINHPDMRVRVISNAICSGVAAATTAGIDAATGEWVIRCDADDSLLPDSLQALTQEAERTGASVVWGAMAVNDGRRLHVLYPEHGCSDLNNAPVDTVTFSLCNKIIRRSLLDSESIRPFVGADCWEDLGTVSRVLALRPVTSVIPDIVYIYNLERGRHSLSRTERSKLLADHLSVARHLESWMQTRGLEDRYSEWLQRVKFCAKVKMLRGRGKDVSRWKRTFPEVNGSILRIRHIKLVYRLLFATVAALPVSLLQPVADFCDMFYRKRN